MHRRYDQVDEGDLVKAVDVIERYFPQIVTQTVTKAAKKDVN